jgi:chromosome segregation ATPase
MLTVSSKATIVVTLWNRGQLAYNSEKYPNQIVIERSFDNKGGNTWKFRAERDGPVLDTKKSELDNITAHFAINMDSPLTLLTQDMAKSFLASSDESKLYGLFLSGSSLKQLSEYYDNISQLIVKMRADVKSNEENLPATKAKADHYERIVKAAQRQKEMKEEHQALTYTLAWAFVVERENQLEGDRADLEKEQRRLEKIRADADTIRVSGVLSVCDVHYFADVCVEPAGKARGRHGAHVSRARRDAPRDGSSPTPGQGPEARPRHEEAQPGSDAWAAGRSQGRH